MNVSQGISLVQALKSARKVVILEVWENLTEGFENT